MFGRLFLLFVAVPLLDLVLLVRVGGALGFWPTVAVVVATAALGSWLARREGVAAWRRVQSRMATGGIPGPELIDGLLILLSGALLLTPGFLTDLTGLLGLFPPTRALLRRALKGRFERAVMSGRAHVVHAGPLGAGFGSPFGAGVAAPPTMEDAEVIEVRPVDGADGLGNGRAEPEG